MSGPGSRTSRPPVRAANAAAESLPRFREKFQNDPAGAFREWFRLQEELRDAGETEKARALADDFAAQLPRMAFSSETERARFFHNAAVFFGSPGPAADLTRARQHFAVALAHSDAP